MQLIDFLTDEQISDLPIILRNVPLFKGQDAASRRARLILAKLESFTGTVSLTKDDDSFFRELYASLSTNDATIRTVRRLGLIVLLEHLVQENVRLEEIAPEDIEFFEQIIKAYNDWQAQQPPGMTSKEAGRRALAEARERADTQTQPVQQSRIDRDIIIKFDLSQQMGCFEPLLGSYDAIPCLIDGPYNLLNEYIIERMILSVKKQWSRPVKRLDVTLYQQIIEQPEQTRIIEEALKVTYKAQQVSDLFDKPSIDVVLVIWNHDIPRDIMETIATAFWDRINPQLAPVFTNPRQFITIWVNTSDRLCKPFHVIPRLDNFVVDEVTRYFRNVFFKAEIEEQTRAFYLKQLEGPKGEPMATYHQMNLIVKQITSGA